MPTDGDSFGTAMKRPPTEVGTTFRISELGSTDGGEAISPIREAFEDCYAGFKLEYTPSGKELTHEAEVEP